MTNIDIELRLRPIRFGFLVRPDNMAQVTSTCRANTCLWGGEYNPIIPFFKQVPKWWDKNGHKFENAKQILNGYLDFFEPDYLVEAEKGMADGIGYNSERIIQLADILSPDNHTNIDEYGLNVNAIYADLYHKEYKFALRNKPNIVNISPEDPLFGGFVSCVFGAFPTGRSYKYLEHNFTEVFEPKKIHLNAESLSRLYSSKAISALRLTRRKISVRYNDHNDPALFVLDASEARDLVDFWNLRATHRNVTAIPIQWIQKMSPFCRKFVVRNHYPLPGNSFGVMRNALIMFSRSISENQGAQLFKEHIKTEIPRACCLQHWYPTLWKPSPEFMVRTTRPQLSALETSSDIRLDNEKPYAAFNSIAPEFLPKNIRGLHYANVANIRGWAGNHRIATTFPCDYRNPVFPRFRLGRGAVLPTTEGLVFFPKYQNIPERWVLPSGNEGIGEWLKENKIPVAFSDAGRSTQQIIEVLDGFWGVGKIASKRIVELLNSMSRKPVTRSMHYKAFRERTKDPNDRIKWRKSEFDVLVEHKAVELGLEIKCSKCGSKGWHPLNQLAYSIKCELCLKEFNFPIINPGTESNWAYRLAGPFALPDYANGGYASALAIRFFSDVLGSTGSVDVTWSSGQRLQLNAAKEVESDFILWYQRRQLFSPHYPTEIIFGEAKSFGKDAFKDEDVDRMKHLAERFPGAVLVFATMKELADISKSEIQRLKRLAEWGRKFDTEKTRSRAPVIVLTGTELFSSDNLHHSWKTKGGAHAKFAGIASMNFQNLRVLADLTQQLYLGMPSYHAYLEKMWKKRRAK